MQNKIEDELLSKNYINIVNKKSTKLINDILNNVNIANLYTRFSDDKYEQFYYRTCKRNHNEMLARQIQCRTIPAKDIYNELLSVMRFS